MTTFVKIREGYAVADLPTEVPIEVSDEFAQIYVDQNGIAERCDADGAAAAETAAVE